MSITNQGQVKKKMLLGLARHPSLSKILNEVFVPNSLFGQRTKENLWSRCGLHYQACSLSLHDLIPAYSVGIVHQASHSPLSEALFLAWGAEHSQI